MEANTKTLCSGDILLKPSENVASSHGDYRRSPLKEMQVKSENSDTPQKLSTSTQPPPLKTCMASFCDTTIPCGDTAPAIAIPSSSSYLELRFLESSPSLSVTEKDSGKNVFRAFECSSPINLESSMSNISLNTFARSPFSDRVSMCAQRASDVSDISMNESQVLLSDEDISDLRKLEGFDRASVEFPIDCWKVCSPRKPRSSVGQFLNWRRNKRGRRKGFTSDDNIGVQSAAKELSDSNSSFLKTI